eukprot:CAMPEP_0170280752 /NCGR_PEP_ID=MMETSP0116_2-20130129/40394_1 /TAXON_ID=400756 /ORGANISM="Durinskia baltica, Strain CSIRO CS-38" /LENGTH=39 /DNA_ID= /DNA_START= /DNA_END= /DNA_ORIENTATION=
MPRTPWMAWPAPKSVFPGARRWAEADSGRTAVRRVSVGH